jgi:hypothetical protein
MDWGAMFRTQHKGFFPDLRAKVSSGIGPPTLNYILQAGGSGYFPLWTVRTHLSEGRLHRIMDAPTIRRPGYLVYAVSSAKSPALELGILGLRTLARETWS